MRKRPAILMVTSKWTGGRHLILSGISRRMIVATKNKMHKK